MILHIYGDTLLSLLGSVHGFYESNDITKISGFAGSGAGGAIIAYLLSIGCKPTDILTYISDNILYTPSEISSFEAWKKHLVILTLDKLGHYHPRLLDIPLTILYYTTETHQLHRRTNEDIDVFALIEASVKYGSLVINCRINPEDIVIRGAVVDSIEHYIYSQLDGILVTSELSLVRSRSDMLDQFSTGVDQYYLKHSV